MMVATKIDLKYNLFIVFIKNNAETMYIVIVIILIWVLMKKIYIPC